MNKISILTITFLVVIGATTACSSTAENSSANNKTTGGAGKQNSAANDNKKAENKSTENKVSQETTQTNLTEIYDGRSFGKTKNVEISTAEKDLIETEVKAKEAAIKAKNSASCEKDNFSVASSIKGSFTKPNSAETAYFYSLCDDGSASSPIGIGGIIIFEAGKVTALYTFENIGSTDVKSLPDINKKGLSESRS